MTYRMSFSFRLGEFLIYTGIVIILLLLVVVPVQSQNPIPTPGPPEATQPLYQDAPRALLLFLMLQFVFLLIFVVSYLVDPKRLQRARELHVPGRWYGYLHLPR